MNLREKVDNYLHWNDISPLEFYEHIPVKNLWGGRYKFENVRDMDIKKYGLKTVIINTLEHTNYLHSGTNDELIETRPNCLRSSLDIWRHIINYNPEVTIYDVMKCIANNWEDMGLYSHFCNTIGRRVFRISDGDDYNTKMYDCDETDEYGLEFNEWSEL